MKLKHFFSLIPLLVALSVWGWVGVRPAEAATFQVAAPCGATEFVAAYNAARTSGNPSDTVSFTANCTFPVEITLAAALPNMDQAKTLIIDGTNGIDNYARVTINGGGGVTNYRMVVITAGTLEVNGLILQNFHRDNNSGSVLRSEGASTMIIRNSSFINNNGTTNTAGAVEARTGSTLQISSSFFGGNTSSGAGGAVRLNGANNASTIVNSTFVGNSTAGNGGAIGINAGTVTLNNVTAHNNTTGAAGSNLRVASDATANVNNSIFSGADSCSIQVGGILNATNSYASAAGCTGFTTNANAALFTPLTPSAPATGTHPPVLPPVFVVGDPGSSNPAVNTLSLTCEATDQRGINRAAQECDAGAMEAFTPTAVTMSDMGLGQTAVSFTFVLVIFLLLAIATAVRLHQPVVRHAMSQRKE